MNIHVGGSGGVVRVTVVGDFDLSRYAELETALKQAAADTRPVLIELTESTRYTDSVTLSELLLFKRRLDRQGRPVALWARNPAVFRFLAIAGVTERLNVFRDEQEALALLLTSEEPTAEIPS